MTVPGRDLAGRGDELARIDAVLADARQGKGGLVLVSGEPGIGKSRLLAEVATTAAQRGFTVAAARALEAVVAAPYGLLIDASAVADVALPEPPDAAGWADPEAARDSYFDAVGDALVARTSAAPLALLLDDLHWADAPTLRFVEHFARRVGALPTVVVVAYRSAEVRRGSPLARCLGAVGAAAPCERIELMGLDEVSIAAIGGSLLGTTLNEALLEDLVNETGGNPLFVLEILRSLDVSRGQAARRGGLPVPSGVREAIFARLAALPATTSETLDAAAVLGGEFDLGPLAAMLGLDVATVLSRLVAAEAANLVAPTATRAWRYTFSHPLICRAIAGDMSGKRSAELHYAAALAVEAVVPAHLPGRAPMLAYHYGRAIGHAGAEPAFEYARMAGHQAAASLAYEDAVRLYGDALTIAETLPALEPGDRAELLIRQADALLRSGETTEARRSFAAAAETAAAAGDGDRLARAALGRAGYRGTPGLPDLDALTLLDRAAAAEPPDLALRARVASRLAMELYYVGDPERRAALSAEAVELARRVGDGSLLAQVLIGRHYALDEVRNVAERTAAANEAARSAESVGDAETAMLAYYLLVRDHLEVGDRVAAEQAGARHAELSRDARQPLYPWRTVLLHGLFAHLDGDLDRAERLANDARAMAQAASIPNGDAAYAGLILAIRLDQGRMGELLALATEGRRLYPRLSTWAPIVGLCQLQAGDRDAARRTLAQVMATWGQVPEDEGFLPTSNCLAALVVGLRDARAAARVASRLVPHANRCVVVPGPVAGGPPVAWLLAGLAEVQGRNAEAQRWLALARRHAERLGAPRWARLDTASPLPAGLSTREAEVLALVAQGLTNREIAERLVVGIRTIDSHVTSIYRKVGARRRSDAVAFALANGLGADP